jgi:hypothetical protein
MQNDEPKRRTPARSRGGSSDLTKEGGDAAENRHPLHGAMKDLIRIVPGTDLAEPADPGWGEVWTEEW